MNYEQSNVGLGMVPCRPKCGCSECRIDRLRAERDRLAFRLHKIQQRIERVVAPGDVLMDIYEIAVNYHPQEAE